LPADSYRPSPAPAGPEVSFIVPLYNCLPLTQAMLAGLRAHLPAGLSHEIILIDDGSTDGTRDWLATLADPAIRVLLNERNCGYAIANNRAAGTARGRLLALLNSDLVLTPGWLEPMLAAHARLGREAGLVGNLQLQATTGQLDHAGIIIDAKGKPEHLRECPRPRWRKTVVEMPAVTAACVLLSRSLWAELGGFDEGYLNGGEDLDLCFRARASGRRNVVALRSIVRHHVSASPGRKLRDEQNSYRLMRRWHREFVACATEATRAWCRNYLAALLASPRSDDYLTAIAAVRHVLRAGPAPAAARIALEDAQRKEFVRWQAMFPDPAAGATPAAIVILPR
jgi:GT2 family glycosyltransferase